MTEYIANSVDGWGTGYTKTQAIQALAYHNAIDPEGRDTVLVMLYHVPGGAHHSMSLNGIDGPVIDAEAVEIPAAVYDELHRKAYDAERAAENALFGDDTEDVTDDIFPESTGPNDAALHLYKYRRESDHGWTFPVEKVDNIEVTDLPGIDSAEDDPRHVERDSS